MIMEGDEVDPIAPVGIHHSVDELWADDERTVLEQRYNFLDYHFEREGRYCRARAYLDEPDSVTVYGPFISRQSLQPVPDATFANDVARYLLRRYEVVETLEAKLGL